MRYGCVIWKVRLCYLEVWSSLCGMVVLVGGYGLHYDVWLCHLGVCSSLWFMVVSFGGVVVLFMVHGLYFGVW